jgi:hypothetical protein
MTSSLLKTNTGHSAACKLSGGTGPVIAFRKHFKELI